MRDLLAKTNTDDISLNSYECELKTGKGKDGVIGKSKEQLILDLQEKHTVDNWILSEEYENSKLNEDPNENTGLFVEKLW